MNGYAAAIVIAGLAFLGCSPGEAKPDFAWPKDGKFACTGVLTRGEDGYQLTPDRGMLPWCDAAIRDEDAPRVLKACTLGAGCEIRGSIRGHGTFGWVAIAAVRRAEATAAEVGKAFESPADRDPGGSTATRAETAAEQRFGTFRKVKAWQPRAVPVDLADMDAWNMFFPRSECAHTSSPHPDVPGATRFVVACPHWAGSRQLTFRFRTVATDPQSVYLDGVDVDGDRLSVPQYEAFIERPFFAYGSFQELLHDEGMMRVAAGDELVDFMSVNAFSEKAESSIYTCGVIRQKASEAVIGCRADEAARSGKTAPFFVQIRRTEASWLLHAVQTQNGPLRGRAMMAFLTKALRSR